MTGKRQRLKAKAEKKGKKTGEGGRGGALRRRGQCGDRPELKGGGAWEGE